MLPELQRLFLYLISSFWGKVQGIHFHNEIDVRRQYEAREMQDKNE